MLSVIFSLIFITVICYLTGRIVIFLIGHNNSNFFDTEIIGVVTLNTIFTLINFLYPINHYVTFFVSILILIIFLIYRKQLNQENLNFEYKTHIWFLPLIIVLAIFACNAPTISDSGLYHLQAVKWIENYAVVPGEGNIHGRLAFNPAVFSLFAGCNLRGIYGIPVFVMNLFVGVCFLMFIFLELKNGTDFSINHKAFIFCAGIISIEYIVRRINSPTPDLFAGIIPFYLLIRIIKPKNFYATKEVSFSRAEIIFITILCFYSFTIKISNIILLILPMLVFLKERKNLDLKFYMKISLICFILIFPWVIRNYILSGYVIYPLHQVDIFNPDWKIPIKNVIEEEEIIKKASRNINQPTEKPLSFLSFSWVSNWLYNIKIPKKITLILLVAGILLAFAKIKTVIKSQNFFVILTAVSGAIFWFLTAPDMRFGFACISFCILAPLLIYENKIISKIYIHLIPTICIVSLLYIPITLKTIVYFLIIYIVLNGLWFLMQKKNFYLIGKNNIAVVFSIITLIYSLKFLRQEENFISSEILIKPLEPNYYAKSVEYLEQRQIGNVKIYQSTGKHGCYDGPLPCVNNQNEKLKLRGKNIQDGFKIEN
ncbi:MAG: LIC_10190 family membrane protein [Bacteroidota bacterium]